MYCDYVFIKARRVLQEIARERKWNEFREMAKKHRPVIPNVYREVPPRAPLAFVDYADVMFAREHEPLTNPDQLICWDGVNEVK